MKPTVKHCEEFSVSRQGMCNRPLDKRGQCPNAGDHGDSFTGKRE